MFALVACGGATEGTDEIRKLGRSHVNPRLPDTCQSNQQGRAHSSQNRMLSSWGFASAAQVSGPCFLQLLQYLGGVFGGVIPERE